MSLLDDLAKLEATSTLDRRCQACVALAAFADDGELHDALRRAMGGTIGERRLSEMLAKHGHHVGTRAINRHRREAHT